MKAATPSLHFPFKNLFIFQSTPPVKAATQVSPCIRDSCDISIHAAREGGDLLFLIFLSCSWKISIHAAREGGDYTQTPPQCGRWISIHAAREGGDGLLLRQWC